MKSKPLAIALLIGGIALLVVGPWLPSLTPTKAVWSDEQARDYATASANLHDALHRKAHKHSSSHAHPAGGASEDLQAAKAGFAKQEALLQGARNRLQIWKSGCQGLGILLAASGIGMHLLLRMNTDEQ